MIYDQAFRITSIGLLIIIILFFLVKSTLFFDKDGQIRSLGDKETIFPLCIGIYLSMIFIYLFLRYLEIFRSLSNKT